MESTKGHEYDVRMVMKEKFQLTRKKYLRSRPEDLHALYKRFEFEYPGIGEERFLTVLQQSYK
jgi:hypothetical protein